MHDSSRFVEPEFEVVSEAEQRCTEDRVGVACLDCHQLDPRLGREKVDQRAEGARSVSAEGERVDRRCRDRGLGQRDS